MLRPIDVELLVYREIDRMRRGAQPEDSIVEFKLSLPNADAAALQIGALCNAVQGEDAIWAVGIGEDGSFEPPSTELAYWGPAVEKYFDEVPPIMRNYNVTFEGHPLTLFHFGTQQRPYVVKKNDGVWVVPWRRLNRTHSPRRRDLLNMLSPGIAKPKLHVVSAHVTRERPGGAFNVGMTVYLIPKDGTRVILPLYRCNASLKAGDTTLWLPNQTLSWSVAGGPPGPQPLQLIFREPTFFSFLARHYQPGFQDPLPSTLQVVLQLGYAEMENDAVSITLPQTNIVPEVQHFEWREAGWGPR